MTARRHIPLFLIASVPPLTRVLSFPPGRFRHGAAVTISLAGTAAILGLVYTRGEGLKTGVRADLYPAGALAPLMEIAAVRRDPGPVRVFSLHKWGGFLEWNLPQTFKVFIDGRQLVYGPRLFVDYYKILEDTPETSDLLEKYRPDVFVLDYGSKLGRRLAGGEKETALVHWDDSCLVYVNRKRFPEYVRKHGYRAYNPESGATGSLPAVLAELGKAAAAESPGHARTHALTASLLMTHERFSEADREATAAIRLAPRNPSVLLVGFDAALAVHDLGRASELAHRALRADPGSCAVLLAGVRLASAENRTADAEKAVTAAIRAGEAWREKRRTTDPALGDAYRLKAGLLSAAGNAPGAADSLRTAGNAYFDLGRTADAMECYEAGLKFAPGDARLLHNRGTVSMATGRIPEALADFTRALAREPSNVRMHVSLGVALWKAGRKASARAAWARALELDPTNADALAYLTQAK